MTNLEQARFFWPTWSTITAAAAISAAFLFRKADHPPILATRLIPEPRFQWPPKAVIPLALLGLFLGCYIAAILIWEDFAWYDDSQFILFTLRGINFPLPIWRDLGRFFPLGLQEFNLIRHFTHSAAGYQVFPIAQLLLLSCFLLLLNNSMSLAARAAMVAVALTTPGAIQSFAGRIYPERNVLFWLVCLALFVKLFEQTRSTRWAVAAVVCAQVMLYYKEPAFLLLFIFAALRILMRCRNTDRPGWDLSRLRAKESLLDFCLGALAILFLLYYITVMLPDLNLLYNADQRLSPGSLLRFYVRVNPLAWVLAAVAIVRLYRILRRTAAPLLLWDGLAWGGVAYFSAYLYLRLFNWDMYYLAPVDLIAVLYLSHLLYSYWGRMRLQARIASFVLLVVILCQNGALSAFQLLNRKYIIHEKAEVAQLILDRRNSDPTHIQKLYFPFTSPYTIVEFGYYLSYRGVPVEGVGGESGGQKEVVIFSRRIAKDGLCMAYRTTICHAGSSPAPDSLVIVLPDDPESLVEATPYLKSGEPLLFQDPARHIPKWIRYLRFPIRLPTAWLLVSVTVWK